MKINSFYMPGPDIIYSMELSQTKKRRKKSSRDQDDSDDDSSGSQDEETQLTCEDLYKLEPSNVLVASWMNNLGYPEKFMDDKLLFFNSEILLNNRNILDHFSDKNKKLLFSDKQIEFTSKKGGQKGPNQDNFFIIVIG